MTRKSKKHTKKDGKLKFAFYWAASCGGCEIAVLDINEKILDVLQVADIVFWPVAMDIKYKDVENFADGEIDVCFFNGGIRNDENEHLAKLLRKKSKILVAFGSCACEGCIPGLANLFDINSLFEKVYRATSSTENPENKVPMPVVEVPEGKLTLPTVLDRLKTLDQVVDVDYYLPGCPPPPGLIINAIDKIVKGKLPEKGTVLAPEKSLCDECRRNKEGKRMPYIKRVYEVKADPEKCFIEQGIICMGPVTRSGCGAMCINANMPCTGCMGPVPGVEDQGARMMSAIASFLKTDGDMSEEEIEERIKKIKDPLGTFYMYGFAKSILGRVGWRK